MKGKHSCSRERMERGMSVPGKENNIAGRDGEERGVNCRTELVSWGQIYLADIVN